MSDLKGKTAKEIQACVDTGEVGKAEAIEFVTERVETGYAKAKAGTGRKPRYASVKLLADLQGKTYEDVVATFGGKAKAKKSMKAKPKASKPAHAALDSLAVTYVEADVAKLVAARTTKAALAKVDKGLIKNPQKVANLREAGRRLGFVAPEVAIDPANARIDALESKLDKLLGLFE